MEGSRFKNEKDIYQFWEKEHFFFADPKSKKKPFSLLIPPPNLTGELHLGHAMQHSILDAIARFRRLQGYDVLMLPGVDHAGIQFEGTLDKILAKEGLSKQKLGREKWLARAWQFKDEVYKSFHKDWTIFGISADWPREVFTLDPGPQRAVFEQFKTYYDRGLIYKGPYIVQWCPKCNTAIEDVEVEYDERKEKLYHIKYPISNVKSPISNKAITIATVRPETMFADVAVAVNPKDKRYKELLGQTAVVPLTDREVPIIADDAVDEKFGTGALKVTPGHDFTDYEIGKRHGLPILQVIDKNGRLTELAGKYAGMKVYEAREAMIPHLKEKGILVKEEEYVHSVAVCERCKSVVEPLISEEWFVKVGEMARGAIKVIKADKIKFLPKNYAGILADWLANIHDWCISRSLWWGHRIPVWYPSTRSARSGQVAEIKVSLESPGPGWVQESQVLDTWFSSGLWPLSTLGWPDYTGPVGGFPPASAHSKLKSKGQGKDNVELRAVGSLSSTATRATNLMLNRYFPWDFEISAPEIKYMWIARMIMISLYFTGQIPFKTMFFHGMIRDMLGRKFSKSLGNGIEPNYLIERWGVDATRMVLYSYSIPGRDGRVSREILDERGKNFRNFATKLRNIARFILELAPESALLGGGRMDSPEVEHPDDRWILDQLEKTSKKVTAHLEGLELHLATEELYNFVWHELADVYIEKSKKRRVEAQPVLEEVLKKVLILLHPFMPFLTEEIYQGFAGRKRSIMLEGWPS